MNIFLLIVHILVAILLVIIILIQRGRGGGLVESFSGVESMFGTKTSQFLTRTTAILATIFLFTSISLALLAARQTRSLIEEEAISPLMEEVVPLPEEVLEEGQSAESELPSAQQQIQEEIKEEAISPEQEGIREEGQPVESELPPPTQEQAVQEEKVSD